MTKFFSTLLIFLIFFAASQAASQAAESRKQAAERTDTLPLTTMKSDKLLTLNSYYQDNNIKPKKKPFFKREGMKFVLPSLFIAYGTAARFRQLPVRQIDVDIDHEIRKINNPANPKHVSLDNYLEIVIPGLAFGLDFLPGIASKHNLRDRTMIMLTSYLFMEGVVYGLKKNVFARRPLAYNENHNWSAGTSDNDYYLGSFPSGHTAVAMTGAHILYKEYKDVTPWIGVAGYAMAVTTGALRMYKYKHWLSDVVAGAGIGLLSAEIGYMMLPVWHRLFGLNTIDSPFVAVPQIGLNSYGIGMVYNF